MPNVQDITDEAINALILGAPRKQIIRERYLNVLRNYQQRACRYGRAFHGCRTIVAVGSLLVPALLSIQYIPSTSGSGTSANSIALYWVTWVISLLVTMSNGIYTLIKVDKKYYFLNTLVEQIRSEGWQYISLTGRYAGSTAIAGSNTHEYQFLYFCHIIEKIKMHQVEEEYFKLTDEYTKTHGTGVATRTGAGAAGAAAPRVSPSPSSNNLPSLIPPTPEQPFATVMNLLPTDLRETLEAALGIRPATTAAAPRPTGSAATQTSSQTAPA
jgi:hypothetical protein